MRALLKACGLRWPFIPVVMLVEMVFLSCSSKETNTVSLFDQIAEDQRAGPWRVLALHVTPLGKEISAYRKLLEDSVGLEMADVGIVQTAQVSTIRLQAVIEPRESIVLSLSYRSPTHRPGQTSDWKPSVGGVEARLIRQGAVIATSERAPLSDAVELCLRAPSSGAEAIGISHDLKPGSLLPLRGVVALGLGDTGGESVLYRAKALLEWISKWQAPASAAQALFRKRFPLSLNGCTRDVVALADGDTLQFDIPRGAVEHCLQFWMLNLNMLPGDHALVTAEAEVSGQWQKVASWDAEWTKNQQWRKVVLRNPQLPRWERLRYILSSKDCMVALAEPLLVQRESGQSKNPNLVVIDLDTMRADRLRSYGYDGRQTSARLDSLLNAKGFCVFRNAYSPASWTLPATAKILTSRYLNIHRSNIVPRQYTTLAEVLRKHGYYCVAFTGGGYLSAPGFEQGFHDYHWTSALGKVEDTFPEAMQWLREEQVQPFFMFLHTFEVHTPYTRDILFDGLPPLVLDRPGQRRRLLMEGHHFDHAATLSPAESLYVEAAYDSGVRTACDATADLFELMDERALWDRTVVVVLSDHGEEFWEHSLTFGHHPRSSLHGELLNVPFLLHVPERKNEGLKQIDVEVSTVDMVPTVVDLLGIPAGDRFDGVSLVPALDGESIERKVPILATNWPDREWGGAVGSICVISDGKKYIEPLAQGIPDMRSTRFSSYHNTRELYFIEEDPGEVHNRAEQSPELCAAMGTVLRKGLERAIKPDTSATTGQDVPLLSDQLMSQLKALGYMEEAE